MSPDGELLVAVTVQSGEPSSSSHDGGAPTELTLTIEAP